MAAAKSKSRIVYILSKSRSGELLCTVRTTKLMKWEAFGQVPINFESLFGGQYADSLSPESKRLAMRLRMNTRAREKDVAILAGAEGYAVFRELLASKRAFWFQGSRLRLSWDKSPMPVSLDWRVSPLAYLPQLVPVDAKVVTLPLTPPVYLSPQENLCGLLSHKADDGLLALWNEAKEMDADGARLFCLRLFKRFPESEFPIPDAVQIEEAEAAEVVPVLTLSRQAMASNKKVKWDALNALVLVELRFRYGKCTIERTDPAEFVSYTEAGVLQRKRRDFDFEGRSIQRLIDLGFEEATKNTTGELLMLDAGGYVLSAGSSATWFDLLDQVFPSLEKLGWKVVCAPGFRLVAAGEESIFSEVTQNQAWFEYSVGLKYKGAHIPAVEILCDFVQSHSELPLPEMLEVLEGSSFPVSAGEGQYVLVAGRFLKPVLEQVFELLGDRAGTTGSVRISGWRAAELSASGLIEADVGRCESMPDIARLHKRLKEGTYFEGLKAPQSLQATLRDYQSVGLGWLQFLRETRVHGILADDMGLGKTLQTIANLVIEQEAGRLNGLSLIVAPTSVLENWREEIERFAPDLDCSIYYGQSRGALLSKKGGPKILLTTYSVLRNDIEILSEIEWYYLIVDEAQFIKNASSLASRSVCRLTATHKLCLTGTPIENRLSELWALFHFLMPDFLGPRKLFQQTYAQVIESGADKGGKLTDNLRRRISPFLLRRRKELVASELPSKTEIVRPIELTSVQAERYESVRLAMNARVAKEFEERGFERSRIVVLDALLKLRQICCDPRLNGSGTAADSAKLVTAIELIESLREKGHRILLFSQFTSMLALIEAELKTRKIRYGKLIGSTQKRGDLVRSFQEGEFDLFLISLKAGGTGLNLTQADAVIHYDPWWNPAAESQATDRAHRIGQENPVFVYKLIAENTVEAKILELQRKKGAIAASILSDAPTEQFRDLSEEDLLHLFEG